MQKHIHFYLMKREQATLFEIAFLCQRKSLVVHQIAQITVVLLFFSDKQMLEIVPAKCPCILSDNNSDNILIFSKSKLYTAGHQHLLSNSLFCQVSKSTINDDDFLNSKRIKFLV